MPKDTFYFSHDYNARNDEKIKRLIRKHGMIGYGIFWSIVEDLYNNANALRTDYEGIAYDLRSDSEVVASVVNDFDLFIFDGDFFGSNSVQERLDQRNNKSESARKSASYRWENANALQTQSEGNAKKERKGKEIKGKEKKIKYKDNVLLTENENEKLVSEFGKDTVQQGRGKNAIEAAKNARSSGSSKMVSINDVVWYRFSWNGKDYISNDSGTEVYSWDDQKKTKGARVKMADGGMVKHFGPGGGVYGPGTGTSDSIPAMLSNGEYVIRAASVQAVGVPMLDKINKLAGGGMVSYDIPKYSGGGRVRFADGGLASSSSSLYNINVQLNGTNLTADDVAASIHKEMRLREMASGVNRRVGG